MNSFNRRNFLKAAGVTLALPYLEAFAKDKPQDIKRFVGLQMPFAFLPKYLYESGEKSYLNHLNGFKGKYTLFNGLYNPGVNGQHHANDYFLTGGSTRSKVNSISLDQELASSFPGQTRFNSLTTGISIRSGLSWTRSGIRIPITSSPEKLFTALFLGGNPQEVKNQKRRMAEGKSILDVMSFYEKKVSKDAGSADKHRIDQYFTAVRDVEKELQMSEAWLDKPKPQVEKMTFPRGKSGEMEVYRLFMKIFKLVLQTDSSRFMTFDFGQTRAKINLEGVGEGYHGLSHHRGVPERIEQLRTIENEMFKILGSFIKEIDAIKEGGSSILDKTTIVFGSALDNPNNHSAARPPIILAGGGHKHKGLVKLEDGKKKPFCNLYVSLLQNFGLEKKGFGSSNGTLEI